MQSKSAMLLAMATKMTNINRQYQIPNEHSKKDVGPQWQPINSKLVINLVAT